MHLHHTGALAFSPPRPNNDTTSLLNLLFNTQAHITVTSNVKTEFFTVTVSKTPPTRKASAEQDTGGAYARLWVRRDKRTGKARLPHAQHIPHIQYNLATIIAFAQNKYASWDMRKVRLATTAGWTDAMSKAAGAQFKKCKPTRNTKPWLKTCNVQAADNDMKARLTAARCVRRARDTS